MRPVGHNQCPLPKTTIVKTRQTAIQPPSNIIFQIMRQVYCTPPPPSSTVHSLQEMVSRWCLWYVCVVLWLYIFPFFSIKILHNFYAKIGLSNLFTFQEHNLHWPWNYELERKRLKIDPLIFINFRDGQYLIEFHSAYLANTIDSFCL